jgi:hypothetical protein
VCVNKYIFDLIDNVEYVVYALYSSFCLSSGSSGTILGRIYSKGLLWGNLEDPLTLISVRDMSYVLPGGQKKGNTFFGPPGIICFIIYLSFSKWSFSINFIEKN